MSLAAFHGPWDVQVGAWHYCYRAGVRPNARFWVDLAHWRPAGSLVRSVAREPGRAMRREWIRTFNEIHKSRYRPIFGRNPAHPSVAAVREW